MIQQRLEILKKLRNYFSEKPEPLKTAIREAGLSNLWFIPEFVDLAIDAISEKYLEPQALKNFCAKYEHALHPQKAKTVGITMAGNIPLAGFHDLLCVYLSGHRQLIKVSAKDDVLLKHIIAKFYEWDADNKQRIAISPMLKNCDAYIATGSNNTQRYFEYYFSKYPHIIRRNRTSVAILDGKETAEELSRLADDVCQYFGLGCRNVTKIYVPEKYNFEKLLSCFRKYDHLKEHQKYHNNYDYNLALILLNHTYYMTNESLLLVENDSLFSPVSVLNYSFYKDHDHVLKETEDHPDIQVRIGHDQLPFGTAQKPGLTMFADKVDTMEFLAAI